MEGQKQRHPSGGVSVSTEMVLGLEGVELGADGKVSDLFLFFFIFFCLLICDANDQPTDRSRGQRVGKLAAFSPGPSHAGAKRSIYAVLCHP